MNAVSLSVFLICVVIAYLVMKFWKLEQDVKVLQNCMTTEPEPHIPPWIMDQMMQPFDRVEPELDPEPDARECVAATPKKADPAVKFVETPPDPAPPDPASSDPAPFDPAPDPAPDPTPDPEADDEEAPRISEFVISIPSEPEEERKKTSDKSIVLTKRRTKKAQ